MQNPSAAADAPPMQSHAAQTQTFADYLDARMAASQHDMADAAKYYTAALAHDPANPDLINRAFLYTASAGDIDGAARLAPQVLAKEPDNRIARLALAVVAMKNKDYAGARAQLAKSASGPFTALTISLMDAWAAAGAGDINAALADIDKLKSEGGTDALNSFHRAMILEYAGRAAAADTAYQAAIKAAPDGPRVIDAYGRFLERQNRTADAKALYTRELSDAAMAPVAQAGLARLAASTKPDALVSTPAQGAAEGLFGVAASLTDDNSSDVSVLYLRFTHYLRPEFDLADILLAVRLESIEKYQDAIEAYDSIDQDSPYYKTAQVEIAVDESRLKQNADAEARLKKLTAADPNDVEAWTALGDLFRAENKFTEASAAYDRAIAADRPLTAKEWPLLYARAESEQQASQWPAAERDLQAALKLSPNEPELLNFLGYSWVDQGRNLPEALSMLERARALKPFDGYIADSVGWAYFRLGRYSDAAKTLESAVLLVPGDPTINDHYGDALWRDGRKLDAHFQWSNALAFSPDPKEKAALERKVKDGLPANGATP